MNSICEKIVSLLFPQRCIFCREVSGGEALCCPRCATRLRRVGAEAVLDSAGFQVYSCFYHREHCREALHRFKFENEQELAVYFAGEMSALLEERLGGFPFDAVAYIPMPEVRQQCRGYNQAELLGAAVARQYGVPNGSWGLTRRETFTQHDLNGSMRRKQSYSGFAMEEGAAPVPKRLLLVDDITTTGSTLLGCMRLLQEAGATELTAITVAR